MVKVAELAAACVFVVASIVLLGWAAHIGDLVALPGQSATQRNTAVALLLLSLALPRQGTVWSRVMGGVAAAIAAVTLAEYALGVDSSAFDELLGRDWSADTTVLSPGRMAPGTSLALWLSGISLQCARHPVLRALSGSVVMSLGAVSILGYIADIPRAYWWGGALASMSAPTALCLVLVACAVIVGGHQQARNAWASASIGLVCGGSVTALGWQALAAEGAPVRMQVLFVVVGAGLALVLGWALWTAETLRRALEERDEALSAVEETKQRLAAYARLDGHLRVLRGGARRGTGGR